MNLFWATHSGGTRPRQAPAVAAYCDGVRRNPAGSDSGVRFIQAMGKPRPRPPPRPVRSSWHGWGPRRQSLFRKEVSRSGGLSGRAGPRAGRGAGSGWSAAAPRPAVRLAGHHPQRRPADLAAGVADDVTDLLQQLAVPARVTQRIGDRAHCVGELKHNRLLRRASVAAD